jgi:hypothetical protein
MLLMRAPLFAVLALAGCSVGATCPPIDASVPDAWSTDAALAPRDIGLPDACSPVQPLSIAIDVVGAAESLTSTPSCAEFGRVRVFDHATGALVVDGDMLATVPDCAPGDFDRNLPPGDYDVTIESRDHPQWLNGGSILRPDHCTGGGNLAFCAPLRVIMEPCRSRDVMLVMHCDAAAGPCPDVAWPWVSP